MKTPLVTQKFRNRYEICVFPKTLQTLIQQGPKTPRLRSYEVTTFFSFLHARARRKKEQPRAHVRKEKKCRNFVTGPKNRHKPLSHKDLEVTKFFVTVRNHVVTTSLCPV